MQRTISKSVYRTTIFIFILIGVILRLRLFLSNCSLNIDEATIGVDIHARSFIQIILNQLHYHDLPNRPVGLLILQKLCVLLLGNTEWVLRLVPFLCSIVSLILFFNVVRHFLPQTIQLLALALFSINEYLVYFAASAKQYSADILVTLCLLGVHTQIRKGRLTFLSMLKYGFYGLVAMCFSHTSVFMLVAIVCVELISWWKHKRRNYLILAVLAIWMGGFCILYMVQLRYMVNNASILSSAQAWFLPKTIFSVTTISWIGQSIFGMMAYPGAIRPEWLGVIILGVGLTTVYRNNRQAFIILVSPMVFVLVAACFQKYPFYARYILFIIPLLIIILTYAVYYIVQSRLPYRQFLAGVIIIGLVSQSTLQIVQNFKVKKCNIPYQTVMQYLKFNIQPDDFVYINSLSQFPYWYYVNKLHMMDNISTRPLGQWNRQQLVGQTVGRIYDPLQKRSNGIEYMGIRYEIYAYDKKGIFKTKYLNFPFSASTHQVYKHTPFHLKGKKRVWLILLHGDPDLKRFLFDYFNRSGKLIQSMTQNHSGIYLFDMSQ